MDDYKVFSFYEKRGGVPKNGFTSFSEKGEYFFTYNKNGEVIFISENYTTATARNKGIASVKKNMKDAFRFKLMKKTSGKYYWSLRARNNKEVCITKDFTNKQAAYAGASKVSGKKATAFEKIEDAKSKPTTTVSNKAKSGTKTNVVKKTTTAASNKVVASSASKPKTSPAAKSKPSKVTKPVAKPVSKTASVKPKTTTTKSTPTTKSNVSKSSSTASIGKTAALGAAGLAAVGASGLGNKSFDYLSVESYKGKEGFNGFKDAKSDAHYFGFNNAGKTLLRGRGSKTETENNTNISSVKQLGKVSKNWKKGKTVDGKFYYFLTDEKNNEVAKSAIYENITDMRADLNNASSLLATGATATGLAATGAAAATSTYATTPKSTTTTTAEKTNSINFKKEDAKVSATNSMNNDERERLRLQQLREQAMMDEAGTGTNWLPLLALALIPLLLFFLLFSKCGGCGKTPVTKPVVSTTKAKDYIKDTKGKATKIVESLKNSGGSYSALNFDRGTIEHTLKSCCDDSNCYDGKLYYWGEPNFSNNSTALNTAAVSSIENVALLMKRYRGMTISVIGNSLSTEDESAAGGLSTARAKAMRDLLVSNGVSADRVNYSGNGQGNLINFNGDSKANYQNKRLDIILNSCKSAGGIK